MTQVASYDRATLKVGLEIHVELATRSKMWTAAPNVAHPAFNDAAPNTLLSPVVIGMPGTLPVMNKAALDMSIMVGLAMGCEIAKRAKWDRKSYYYPDLPKNYQISQYDQPICGEGVMELVREDGSKKSIRILRAHLEEDAGKLLHEAPGGLSIDHSIVDLNRAGTPLLEIVTYPDFDNAEDVVRFGQMLRNLCRHLGVSQGIMQKGHMRFEPNINVVIERGGETFATPIVEIKNLNSFKAVQGAINYEYQRQIEDWLETGKVMGARAKSTSGWDDVRAVTTLQREKEDADEYRYFPDPDLVDVVVDDAWLERLRAQMPELPHVRLQRYTQELGLELRQAQSLVEEAGVTQFFEAVLTHVSEAKRVAGFLLNVGQKVAKEQGKLLHELGIQPNQVAGILSLLDADKINSNAAEQVFRLACDQSEKDVEALAKENNLIQVSDTSALDGILDAILADPKNEKAIADIRAGKDKAVGSLIGQVMKASRGQANAKVVTEMIQDKLGAS